PAGHPSTAIRAPLHRQKHRATPLAAYGDALQQTKDGEYQGRPEPDLGVSGQQADQGGSDTHGGKGHYQRRLAPDSVTEVAEDERAQRARGEAYELDGEGRKSPGDRVFFREEELGEHQCRRRVVEEEVVPLDGGSDGAGDDRAHQLSAFRSPRRSGLQVLHPSITSEEICPPPFGR